MTMSGERTAVPVQVDEASLHIPAICVSQLLTYVLIFGKKQTIEADLDGDV